MPRACLIARGFTRRVCLLPATPHGRMKRASEWDRAPVKRRREGGGTLLGVAMAYRNTAKTSADRRLLIRHMRHAQDGEIRALTAEALDAVDEACAAEPWVELFAQASARWFSSRRWIAARDRPPAKPSRDAFVRRMLRYGLHLPLKRIIADDLPGMRPTLPDVRHAVEGGHLETFAVAFHSLGRADQHRFLEDPTHLLAAIYGTNVTMTREIARLGCNVGPEHVAAAVKAGYAPTLDVVLEYATSVGSECTLEAVGRDDTGMLLALTCGTRRDILGRPVRAELHPEVTERAVDKGSHASLRLLARRSLGRVTPTCSTAAVHRAARRGDVETVCIAFMFQGALARQRLVWEDILACASTPDTRARLEARLSAMKRGQ